MARYRQSPNYIAKKSLWPALNWWNLIFFILLIPGGIVAMQFVAPEMCAWYFMAGLYVLVPLTIALMQKKMSWWNLIFFVILIPGLVIALNFIAPDLFDKIINEWLTNWYVVLGVWLVFPFMIILVKSIILKCKYIEFYDNCVIERWGVFNKRTKKTVFPEVTAVTTQKNILGYGDVYIDVVGPWDVTFDDMRRPDDLRDYLVYYMLNAAAVENISNNPYIAATDGIF